MKSIVEDGREAAQLASLGSVSGLRKCRIQPSNFNVQQSMYVFVSEDHMLDWHSC